MPSRPPRKVDPNALLPHLLHRANQAANEFATRALGDCGITLRQYVVMEAVEAKPGLRQAELARDTGIDRSTVAVLVARLAERDIVACGVDATDRRAMTVALTEAGSDLLDACRERVTTAEKTLLARLPANRRALILGLLEALAGLGDGEPRAKPAVRTRRARRSEPGAA